MSLSDCSWLRRTITVTCVLLLALQRRAPAKPKSAPKESEPADIAQSVDLPDNVNLASLRVSAIDTIYEMDLSIAQLNLIRGLATETGDSESRAPGTATPQFISTLKDFQTALLEAKDDQAIAKLRNQVIDLADSPDLHLDNDIVTTARARAKSAAACSHLKASQIAAFLAIHAEEVSDPEELMMSTADGLQEMHAEAGNKADKVAEPAGDADSAIQEASLSVGYLVAGTDDAKAHAITQQVSQWLRASDKLTDAEFAARRQSMEDSAGKIIGDVTPMQVLNNWMLEQMAILLSNPQLPQAIDEIVKCRMQGN
jgi:hypothetical protein